MLDIIIPFKNADKFIPSIVDCLSKQKNKNFTAHFISDGENRESIAILESINKEFQSSIHYSDGDGPGSARNKGVSVSKNKYYSFVDVDDKISVEYTDLFLTAINVESPDIIECMYQSETPDGKMISGSNIESYISREDRFISLMNGSLPRLSWGKAYKRDYMQNNNVSFPEGIHNGEDHIFLLKAYINQPSVKILYSFLYQWIRYENSLTNRAPSIKNIDDFISVSEEKLLLHILYNQKNSVDQNWQVRYGRRLFKEARSLISQISRQSSNHDTLIKRLQMKLKESTALMDTMQIIQSDNTSYWQDVMEI